MTSVAELFEPNYVGEDRIKLALALASRNPRAFDDVLIEVDYSGTEPAGVVAPLELIIRPPTAVNVVRRLFQRPPKTLTFRPREGGQHLVVLRERWHNKWHGTLLVQVAGDPIGKV